MPPGLEPQPLSWAACSSAFCEVIFPNTQYKPPLAQLGTILFYPIACSLGEETNPHLATASGVTVTSGKCVWSRSECSFCPVEIFFHIKV